MTPPKTLVMICGPTASGKTSLSVELAKVFQTEILSADSRQFYKEMSIGTAKPDSDEMEGVPHHFIGHLSVKEEYNVSAFEKDSLDLLNRLFQKRSVQIMVGGSGLYLKAVSLGIDELPDPHPALRDELNEIFSVKGIKPLQERLKKLDPEYYSEVDKNNPKRLMRAIEVCETSKKKYSELRKAEPKSRPFRTIKIGLEMPREELFERIHQRTDQMIDDGLVEEVRSLKPYQSYNALNTVGYKEIFRYLDKEISLEQAITDIKTNTRRYAKRQITWFKKDNEIKWFHPKDKDIII
ncbi:MAG TPA: tRNA (adenosine(37)-N6)-dimethylallyltransferase MiaA, partial [Bacteroidales bacterium]|nr:tRNA (adenosine(37)-N6)-dimethylallyltransferase MiaA [Bacteroidales bacterium]